MLRRTWSTTACGRTFLAGLRSQTDAAAFAAHLNLRDEQLPHKHLIAQVLLDKNAPRIRTVLNKLGTITNEYRVFAHEVLAGPPELDVTVREAGCERRRRPSYVFR